MGSLRIQVCRSCGRGYYPPKIRCSCGSRDFYEVELREPGRIVTLTTIYVPPIGFEPPLRVAIAEFSKHGLKVLGRIDGDYDLKVGDRVWAVENNGVVVFSPAEGGEGE